MSEHHQVFDVSRPGGRMKWIFAEFWQVMFFGLLFLLMVSLPITFSGIWRNPLSGYVIEHNGRPLKPEQYVQRLDFKGPIDQPVIQARPDEVKHPADYVWPAYGLLFFSEFLAALMIAFVAPAWLGPYMVLLAIYSLVIAEEGGAWAAPSMPWGSIIAILFLMYVAVGLFVFWQAGQSERKRRL